MGLRITRKLMTESWTADALAVEAAVGRFSEHRPVTNDCQVALFEIAPDEHFT
jgi:hypothetical protein